MLEWVVSSLAVHAFGVGTVVLAVAVSVPQYLHLRRGGTAAGVSLPAVLNSAISFFAWTAYALYITDGWLIASSAVGLPFAAITVYAAWKAGAARERMWLPAVWSGVLLGTGMLDLITGRHAAELVVGASIGWFVIPAIVKAWTSRDVSGIAAGSWWVQALEGGLFLGYGLAGDVYASVVYGVVAMAGSGAVLGRLALGYRPLRVPRHRADTPRIVPQRHVRSRTGPVRLTAPG
ncbi:hypothetical protein [Kineosporia sp. NBRC 101731]|uniref:hypothetical protein n=1 Tax=Kineosporia sp. NBRC 101731 TaxID=3032199 RepID=UPI0024A33D68|nr:hypothetical protein [Kineosporia sp. NBRC 101731]GLY27128.1 hypothetical protein Kisp02_04930 [Kineosporia sp. NBRC 101731]